MSLVYHSVTNHSPHSTLWELSFPWIGTGLIHQRLRGSLTVTKTPSLYAIPQLKLIKETARLQLARQRSGISGVTCVRMNLDFLKPHLFWRTKSQNIWFNFLWCCDLTRDVIRLHHNLDRLPWNDMGSTSLLKRKPKKKKKTSLYLIWHSAYFCKL